MPAAGRVGFFSRVDDFYGAHQRTTLAGVRFLAEPTREPYGGLRSSSSCGNRWTFFARRDSAGRPERSDTDAVFRWPFVDRSLPVRSGS